VSELTTKQNPPPLPAPTRGTMCESTVAEAANDRQMPENESHRKAERKAAYRRRRGDPHKGPHKSGPPHRGPHKAANRRPQRDPHRKPTDIGVPNQGSLFLQIRLVEHVLREEISAFGPKSLEASIITAFWCPPPRLAVEFVYGDTRASVYGPYPSFWCSRGVSVSV